MSETSGEIHDRTLEFSPGINVLYGENESGKTTVHTFIKSMLSVFPECGKSSQK
ncbi:MAG: ATP-binding protein [Blautia wexlerae]